MLHREMTNLTEPNDNFSLDKGPVCVQNIRPEET